MTNEEALNVLRGAVGPCPRCTQIALAQAQLQRSAAQADAAVKAATPPVAPDAAVKAATPPVAPSVSQDRLAHRGE